MIKAPIGPAVPEAGVMATNPATAPVANPTAVGFPLRTHSSNIQVTAAVPVAICVESLMVSVLLLRGVQRALEGAGLVCVVRFDGVRVAHAQGVGPR